MKTALETSLACLFIALALSFAFNYAMGQSVTSPAYTVDLPWLKVRVVNNPGQVTKPENVVIYSTMEPVVSEHLPHKWLIQFTSEIH